jgi:CRP-like cAMP-binding protein
LDGSLQLISPLSRAFHLRRLGGFHEVAPANLAALALLTREHSFAEGAVLWRAGERIERVHMVVDGLVRVRGGEYGDEVVGAEQAIGMLSLLARDTHGLDAVAESDTLTLALGADDLFNSFEDDFGILYSQIRHLAAETLRVRKRTPEGTYLTTPGFGDQPSGEMDLVQRLLFLRRNIFRNANVEALIVMAQHMRAAQFEPGTKLWEIGSPSGFLYAILSGRVRCTTADGTQFVCGPGYPLGHLESQCDAARWYEAVAETAVTAMRNDVDLLIDVLEQHFDMAVDFVSGMASALMARRAEIREEAETRKEVAPPEVA